MNAPIVPLPGTHRLQQFAPSNAEVSQATQWNGLPKEIHFAVLEKLTTWELAPVSLVNQQTRDIVKTLPQSPYQQKQLRSLLRQPQAKIVAELGAMQAPLRRLDRPLILPVNPQQDLLSLTADLTAGSKTWVGVYFTTSDAFKSVDVPPAIQIIEAKHILQMLRHFTGETAEEVAHKFRITRTTYRGLEDNGGAVPWESPRTRHMISTQFSSEVFLKKSRADLFPLPAEREWVQWCAREKDFLELLLALLGLFTQRKFPRRVA